MDGFGDYQVDAASAHPMHSIHTSDRPRTKWRTNFLSIFGPSGDNFVVTKPALGLQICFHIHGDWLHETQKGKPEIPEWHRVFLSR